MTRLHRWPWKNLGWVALSGVMMALALPPLSLWPLAWVALVPLWRVVQGAANPWAAAGYGLWWGLVYYGISLVWITHLHPLMWLGVPWVGSIAIALGAWGVITLWGSVCVAIWGAGLRWMMRWPQATLWRILASTALWCLLETLRNHSPLDWSPLGLTQSPHNLAILPWVRLSGPTVLTALIVLANGLWAEALQPRNVRWGKRGLLGLGLGVVILSHGLGWVSDARSASSTVSDSDQSLTLGLVQGNVPTREKLTPAGIRQAITAYTEGYQALASQGVDAVITPEGALPVIWRPGDPLVAAVMRTVDQTGVPLWLGTFAPVEGEPRHYTQSLLELRPDVAGLNDPRSARYHARYNKVQLVPLGEYIPFEPVLGRIIQRLSPLDSYLVPGQPGQRFETSLGLATVGICYESAYSRLFRQQTRQGASFIVTASNNDPYPPGMMAQHHAFDVLRAVESDRWAVRVTNTGLSGLVDNRGRTRWLGQPQITLAQAVTLDRRQTQTPYVRWGDWLLPLLVAGSILWRMLADLWAQSRR
ncbi:MAG: apolipoprotein N-acyltransferase [Spirulina sp.]